MTTKHLLVTAAAALLLSVAGSAQTPSDLLQKGIHAQEAAGDLDGAIAIFRQVVNTSSTNKPLAAQAQYQLVLCMLQKGDRAAAQRELAALERNFSNSPDLLAKAKKLIPGAATLLPEPWGEDECEQLNIKRDGTATGEYLFYSADAWTSTRDEQSLTNERRTDANSPYLDAVVLEWELKTRRSTRSITVTVDRQTRRLVEATRRDPEKPRYASDDELGDDSVAPFTGPATDVEQSVFLLRQLPLAVGYKTTIPVTSNSIAPAQLELTVTGIESVQTLAGKFNCYKVFFAALGQTFWVGVEGKRPLVKFQSGGVEADLVKVWGPEKPLGAVMSTLQAAGFSKYGTSSGGPGGLTSAMAQYNSSGFLTVTYLKRYTPTAEIANALQQTATSKFQDSEKKVRPESIRMRTSGGTQTLTCLFDYPTAHTVYAVWMRTENGMLGISVDLARPELGAFRWRFDPVVAALSIP